MKLPSQKWCTNYVQPSLKTLIETASILMTKPADLINNIEQ